MITAKDVYERMLLIQGGTDAQPPGQEWNSLRNWLKIQISETYQYKVSQAASVYEPNPAVKPPQGVLLEGKPKKVKRQQSRVSRWQDAASDARSAFDVGSDNLRSAIESLKEIQDEYSEWRDALPDSLRSSATGEKLDTICDLDLDSPLQTLDDIDSAIAEAEGMDLPYGYGKD